MGEDIFQSTGCIQLSCKYWLVLEKCLQPKKPLYAENGDGWAASKTKCFFVSINDFLLFEKLPHNIKTTCSFFSEMKRITVSVKISRPNHWCDEGTQARTVKKAFKSKTPSSCDHFVRSQLDGTGCPRSSCNSL